MVQRSLSSSWGSWVLGDLSDAVWQTADLLSNAVEVESLTVRPPARHGLPPRVLVVVPDQVSVMRLSMLVTGHGGFVSFDGRFDQRRWCANLGDLELTVATWSGTEQAERDTALHIARDGAASVSSSRSPQLEPRVEGPGVS
jgi:hypothetical protein